MYYTTKNAKQTIQLGKMLAKILKGSEIIALYGELGSGKTTFVKGIAEGLGIESNITSPTFTLMNIYKIDRKKLLCHIDTYRLHSQKDLITIGAQDYIGAQNVITVIEWPKKAKNLLKNKNIIKIYFQRVIAKPNIASQKKSRTLINIVLDNKHQTFFSK
jgi:tRNA threonylcarbamoyladenosine biosynthesis protein TsaE